MTEALRLRGEQAPSRLVLVRLGRNTLIDEKLRAASEDSFDLGGLFGFSAFGLGDGGYPELARCLPLLPHRQWVLEARAKDLLGDGFPLLATNDHPHWTILFSEPTATHFSRSVAISQTRRRTRCGLEGGDTTMKAMAEDAYDLSYDPNEVGPDLVVECRIHRGPRSSDPAFDPTPGDSVRVGDDEGAPLKARVVRRTGDRVWVQIELPVQSSAVA